MEISQATGSWRTSWEDDPCIFSPLFAQIVCVLLGGDWEVRRVRPDPGGAVYDCLGLPWGGKVAPSQTLSPGSRPLLYLHTGHGRIALRSRLFERNGLDNNGFEIIVIFI